jgi:hypothetical protein
MKTLLYSLAAVLLLTGCVAPSSAPAPHVWNSINEITEAEYAPFAAQGTAGVSGQAFLTQAGGAVVKGAGAIVNLDPATTIGNEWWTTQIGLWANIPPDWSLTDAQKYQHAKARMSWTLMTPPSAAFAKARRSTTADAEGRFKFTDVPAGKYYVSTTVSWMVGYAYQGGLVGQAVEVTEGKTAEVMLTHRPRAQ